MSPLQIYAWAYFNETYHYNLKTTAEIRLPFYLLVYLHWPLTFGSKIDGGAQVCASVWQFNLVRDFTRAWMWSYM